MPDLPIDPSSQDYDDETGELDPEAFPVPEAFAAAWSELEAEEAGSAEEAEPEAER